jgi:hypothetical protein
MLHASHRCTVGDIEYQWIKPFPQLGSQLLQAGFIARGTDHSIRLFDQQATDRLSNTTTRTRYQNDRR